MKPACATVSSRVRRASGSGIRSPASAPARASAVNVLALELALDLCLSDRAPPVDIPRVHDDADAPSGDRKDRPEEHVHSDDRPDHYEERIDQHVDEQVGVEVAPLLPPSTARDGYPQAGTAMMFTHRTVRKSRKRLIATLLASASLGTGIMAGVLAGAAPALSAPGLGSAARVDLTRVRRSTGTARPGPGSGCPARAPAGFSAVCEQLPGRLPAPEPGRRGERGAAMERRELDPGHDAGPRRHRQRGLQLAGLVAAPNPGGTAALDFNGLTSVRCATATSCWAVGSAASPAARKSTWPCTGTAPSGPANDRPVMR